MSIHKNVFLLFQDKIDSIFFRQTESPLNLTRHRILDVDGDIGGGDGVCDAVSVLLVRVVLVVRQEVLPDDADDVVVAVLLLVGRHMIDDEEWIDDHDDGVKK
jgi:hypothetical protein